jgi:hypothetical protein
VTRGGQRKKVPIQEWRGRRDNGRAFLASAKALRDLADEGSNGNPIMSHAISAAIAFADALTIRFSGTQNVGEHANVTLALGRALGDRADAAQVRRLGRILGRKDAVQYGHRQSALEEARELVEQCERFAEWAERILATPE